MAFRPRQLDYLGWGRSWAVGLRLYELCFGGIESQALHAAIGEVLEENTAGVH